MKFENEKDAKMSPCVFLSNCLVSSFYLIWCSYVFVLFLIIVLLLGFLILIFYNSNLSLLNHSFYVIFFLPDRIDNDVFHVISYRLLFILFYFIHFRTFLFVYFVILSLSCFLCFTFLFLSILRIVTSKDEGAKL